MDTKNISPYQNFGAKYMATTKIKEKLPFLPIYKKIDVDFVELDRNSDIDSLRAYVTHKSYSKLSLRFLANLQKQIFTEGYKAFAITRQRTHHETLSPQKIIGICDGYFTCDWRDGNIFFIEHLETMSKNNKQQKPNKKILSFLGFEFQIAENIKNVGKAMLKNIIATLGDNIDSIQLESLASARSFYRHLGFKNDCLNPDYYRLSFNDFGKLMKKE
ncbi:MAG: hypothetical protein K2F57_04560 [Candidatus Gastranaerophilales bacterium]|nr:hypothetical protein [Candidatus Gastranaerophilales bacterium]